MMFQKFLIALGVCVAVTVGLFYAKENGERSGSRPLGHLWSLFHLFGDQCETNSKTSLTSRPQEVFSSSHQLPVRRHINWNNQRPDLKEDLAHLV